MSKKENLAIVIRYRGTEGEQCLHLFDFESGQSNFLIARYLANWIFWLICTMESTSIYTRKYLTDELWNTSCFWTILPNTLNHRLVILEPFSTVSVLNFVTFQVDSTKFVIHNLSYRVKQVLMYIFCSDITIFDHVRYLWSRFFLCHIRFITFWVWNWVNLGMEWRKWEFIERNFEAIWRKSWYFWQRSLGGCEEN